MFPFPSKPKDPLAQYKGEFEAMLETVLARSYDQGAIDAGLFIAEKPQDGPSPRSEASRGQALIERRRVYIDSTIAEVRANLYPQLESMLDRIPVLRTALSMFARTQ